MIFPEVQGSGNSYLLQKDEKSKRYAKFTRTFSFSRISGKGEVALTRQGKSLWRTLYALEHFLQTWPKKSSKTEGHPY